MNSYQINVIVSKTAGEFGAGNSAPSNIWKEVEVFKACSAELLEWGSSGAISVIPGNGFSYIYFHGSLFDWFSAGEEAIHRKQAAR